MRCFALSMAVLLWFVSVATSSADSLMVVAVPQSSANGKQVLDVRRPFHVLFCNLRAKDLQLWDEQYSSGYFNLSFEFKGFDGKVVKVTKNPAMGWTWNPLGARTIKPGSTYTATVDLTDKNRQGGHEWLGVEALSGTMIMRTVYSNPSEQRPDEAPKDTRPSAQKMIASVWTGRVKSDPIEVVIKR